VGIKFEEETTASETPATELKFAVEGTLADGTKIYSTADEWVVGVDIYTQDAEGNPVPVPAGEYLLEDGVTKVYVGEEGTITEIEREEQSTEMSSEKTELGAAVETAKKDAEALKTELASVKKAPAVPSVKSQEFKKNAVPVVASNGNSFSDFMADLRAKQSK
jgi:hypothetical protein